MPVLSAPAAVAVQSQPERPASPTPVLEQPAARPRVKDAHSQLIMVVEDDDDIRDVVVNWLVAYGYNTVAAPDRDHALRMAYSISPAVILLDLWMPGMEAKPFLWAVRALTPKPAVVLMTATSNAHRTAQDLGIEVCLCKPFTTEEMERALRQCGVA